MHPTPLRKGDTIGLIAPSSPLNPGDLEKGIHFLEEHGFRIKLGKHINDADRFLAGKDEDRAKDIMDFFKDKEVKAIIAIRGGQGSQRLLPLLDYEIIAANPKIVVGFSDTIALQLGLLKKTGLITYTGFTLTVQRNDLVEKTLIDCLSGKSFQIEEGTTVHPGIEEGPLVGGNLMILTNLMGTPYQLDFKGSILLIEDVGIEPYNVDGMISQLDLAGVFDQVTGVIFGQFENCVNRNLNHKDTVEDVINEWSNRLKVPCIKDFPYGHGKKNCVLPIGANILLDATKAKLTIKLSSK
jgi:muramoyltetrapeptide carboxypeptidase